MSKVTFVGDPHNDSAFISIALKQAQVDGADLVILLGDNALNKSFYTERLVLDAKIWDMDILFIPGNHDHWDYLDSLLPSVRMHARPYGIIEAAEVGDRVFYLPPATVGCIGGLRFMFVGGADSIDKDWRIYEDNETFGGYGLHSLWFPQEAINEDEMERAIERGLVDILVTHDMSKHHRFEWAQANFPASDRNQERVTAIVDACRPKLHVHGHWHHFYEKTIGLPFDNDGNLDWWEYNVVGLHCNGNRGAVRTYDTEKGWIN